jgi:hypothetical protein
MIPFVLVGLAAIVIASVLERLRERPQFDWGSMLRQSTILPETDLQVEGLARSGDVGAAVAMYQRLHGVDQKKANKAVALLASGQRDAAAALEKSGSSFTKPAAPGFHAKARGRSPSKRPIR